MAAAWAGERDPVGSSDSMLGFLKNCVFRPLAFDMIVFIIVFVNR